MFDCSFPEARWFWLMNKVRVTCFSKTIAFIYLGVSIGISNIWETEWLALILLRKCSETAVSVFKYGASMYRT